MIITQGKKYKIWLISLFYIAYAKEDGIITNPDQDVGYRVSIILMCWAMIESFVRSCLIQKTSVEYHRYNLSIDLFQEDKDDCIIRFYKKIKAFFKKSKKIDEPFWQTKLREEETFKNFVSLASWGKLKKISKQIELDLQKELKNESWKFLIHLYNTRNKLIHGNDTLIWKTPSSEPNIVESNFKRVLNELDGQKVINLNSVNSINDIFNKRTTDYFIRSTLEVLDDLSKVYHNTIDANIFKDMKDSVS